MRKAGTAGVGVKAPTIGAGSEGAGTEARGETDAAAVGGWQNGRRRVVRW